MFISNSKDFNPRQLDAQVEDAIGAISAAELRGWVKWLATPRHFVAQPEANREAGIWIAEMLRGWGYQVQQQGFYGNVVALPDRCEKMALVCAHYDSVPMTPGADDNASAVAAMLGAAKVCASMKPRPDVGFVAFNCEEDGMVGSIDFVREYLPGAGFAVSIAHVLEMVGFASSKPGSQRIPETLPINIPDVGDFIAVLANGNSARVADAVLTTARSYLPSFPAMNLKVTLGLERLFPVLERSDHAPFWKAEIPAVMWTDTSEFRNPHYHLPSDTPDTLDYEFLANVTKLLSAHLLSS